MYVYLGVRLTSYIKHMYDENYGTMINKTKEVLNKWRKVPGW